MEIQNLTNNGQKYAVLINYIDNLGDISGGFKIANIVHEALGIAAENVLVVEVQFSNIRYLPEYRLWMWCNSKNSYNLFLWTLVLKNSIGIGSTIPSKNSIKKLLRTSINFLQKFLSTVVATYPIRVVLLTKSSHSSFFSSDR